MAKSSMRQTLDGQLKHLGDTRWSRHTLRMLLRFVWIALSVWCVALGVHLVFDWPLHFGILALVVLICLVFSVAWFFRPRMSPYQVARRLDQRFRLNEQLTTALEVSTQGGAPEGVAAHLLEQSNHTVNRVQRYVSTRQRFPWSEVTTVVALLVMVVGLLLFVGLGPLNVQPVTSPLPPLVDPQNPVEEFPPEPSAGSQDEQAGGQDQSGQPDTGEGSETGESNENRAVAMSALADALRDQSVTRPAADALDRGDTDQAAQELRTLADQASQLSPATRSDLASALREAAEQIGADNPDSVLDDQLRRNADQLEQGGQEAAAALEDLAQVTEQLGAQDTPPEAGQPGQEDPSGQADQADSGQEQGQGAGSGAGDGSLPGDERAQPQNDRLQVEGVPLELESTGEGDILANGDAQDGATTGAGVGGFEPGSGSPNSDRVQAGEDPLRIPADLRDVVQEYFSQAE